MDIKQITNDLYFECKYLNEKKLDNLNNEDEYARQPASLCVKNILEMLNKLSLEEVIQIRKGVEEVQTEEIKALGPIQRVDEDKYNAQLTIIKYAYFDACMYCAFVERQKVDELD